MSISRRKFLKGAMTAAGAATVTAMVPGIAVAHVPVPEKWDMQADIIIVGYGGAGASAAIEAADNGASVLMLEKQQEKTHYPNTRMSGGIFHSAKEGYNREALKQYALAMFSGQNLPYKLDPEENPQVAEGLADAWAAYLPNMLTWMKSIDPQFNPTMSNNVSSTSGAAFKDFPGAAESGYAVHTSSFSGYVRSLTGTKDKPYLQKESGEAVFALLSKGVNDRKDKIKILYETPAIDLIQNEKGEILGVQASNSGKVVNYKANKAVILTSGGYEYSYEMRMAFLEGQGIDGWAFYGTTANTGDGISMAMKAGAGLAKVGKAASRLIAAPPVRANGLKIGIITPAVGRPNAIVVNNAGKRYIAETKIKDDPSRYFTYKEAVRFDIDTLKYPNAPSWFIMDQTHMDSGPITNMTISTVAYDYIPWSRDNQDAVARGWILKANTIKELAELIRKHPENKNQLVPEYLEEAVNNFNAACAAGEDKEFGRRANTLKPVEKGPFYAMPLYAGGPNTKGGIMCNAERQVLRWNRTPVPRLYCAGEIASALKYVYQGGGNVTECMVFGRVAAKNAAKLPSQS